MKRLLIATVVLLLVLGCKSEIIKELDRIEKEIATASTLDELAELSEEATSLMYSPTDKWDYSAEGEITTREILRAREWLQDEIKARRIMVASADSADKIGIGFAAGKTSDQMIDAMRASGQFEGRGKIELRAFAVDQLRDMPQFAEEYERIRKAANPEYRKAYDDVKQRLEGYKIYEKELDEKVKKANISPLVFVAEKGGSTFQRLCKLADKIMGIRVGKATAKDKREMRRILYKSAETQVVERVKAQNPDIGMPDEEIAKKYTGDIGMEFAFQEQYLVGKGFLPKSVFEETRLISPGRKELDQYRKIVELVKVRRDTLLKEQRREFAEFMQKGMRESGWLDYTVTLLGDDEDILIISSSIMDEQMGKEFISDEESLPICQALGFKKVIFTNDYGPVYTWEP